MKHSSTRPLIYGALAALCVTLAVFTGPVAALLSGLQVALLIEAFFFVDGSADVSGGGAVDTDTGVPMLH